jgi:hypothetical protein
MPAGAHGFPQSTVAYKAREAVALFDDYDDLVVAVEELELAGFDRAQISLMRSCRATEKKLGRPVMDVRELEDEPTIPLGSWFDRYELTEGKAALTAGFAYVGSLVAIGAVVADGGGLVAILAAAAVAGGIAGTTGIWLVRLVGRRRALEIKEQLSRGGLLLWAATRSRTQERRAIEILRRHSTRDVHLHDLTRAYDTQSAPSRR